MRVTLFDYGAGNLHSLGKALAGPAREVVVTTDPLAALETDVLVLPGVGAWAPAVEALAPGHDAMREAITRGLPTLGICLGMQLLFDRSAEGAGAGLGVMAGDVVRIDAARVPQIGWNALDDVRDPRLSAAGLTTAYYANSFVCRPTDPTVVVARSTHDGDTFAAAVVRGRTVGVQFHPEKSSAPGLRFVHAVLDSFSR
jgi:glutamine amidotransferase